MPTRYRHLLLLTAALLLSACAAPQQAAMRYLLPAPPDTPRVEWLGTYASEDDFPKTEAQRRMESIVGKPPLQEFTGPSGIAGDGEGKVFVGDAYQARILVYDLVNRKISSFEETDPIEPRQMTFDKSKNLYVADSRARIVRVFSREGKFLRTYGNDQLGKPMGVAVDDVRQRLYVSDIVANKIFVYDLASGKLLSGFGDKSENGDQLLYNPVGIALAADGRIYVVESLNARISIFDPDGKFLKYFGFRDDTVRGMESPRGIAFDSEGNLWIIDFRRGSLRAFNAEGDLLFAMEAPPTHMMGFNTPAAIHIDGNDEIYVADFLRRRFSHWRYLSKKALAAHPITEADLTLIRQQAGGKSAR